MASNQFLYGIPRPKTRAKEIPTLSTIAFTNQLSSLLAQTSTSTATTATTARPRPSKVKSSIFNTHNKHTKKRALADDNPDDVDNADTPSTSTISRKLKLSNRDPLSIVDSSTLQRSKRKLEEKARIYASMKRGDYVPPNGSMTAQVRDANLLVDFDRKWAETGQESGFISSDEESDSADGKDLVEYEDEFGRQRQGTRAEARREERRRAAQVHAAETLEDLSAHPAPPPQLIRGDVIQSAAFNPDAQIAAQMEDLARRRDRSLTPPPASHYDANSEIRSKGVGFYAFSREEGERRREMEELERQRQETEWKRAEQQGTNAADAVTPADESKSTDKTNEVKLNPQPAPNNEANEANSLFNLKPTKPTVHTEAKVQEIRMEGRPQPQFPSFSTKQTVEVEDEPEEVDLASRFLDSLDDEGIR